MKTKRWIALVLSFLLLGALACSVPDFSAPTAALNSPTPNLTTTALFAPTDAGSGIPPTATPGGGDGPTATDPSVYTATPSGNTPGPTSTKLYTPTFLPPSPTVSYVGPGVRPAPKLTANFVSTPLNIDGYITDWDATIYDAKTVVYGADNRDSNADLSATIMVAWDNTYLYLGARVKDDVFVQNATGMYMYKGDSIEVLLDKFVSWDYYLRALSSDDYQLGISPGSPSLGHNPEAYLWFPSYIAGPRANVEIAVVKVTPGYHIEVAIPWSIFGIDPADGMHFGFAFSVSDNDKLGTSIQQSMCSSAPGRSLVNPMTWHDLMLAKP